MCLAELTANRRRGEKKKGDKSEEEDTPAEGRERQQAARTFVKKGGENRAQKRLRIKKRGLFRERRGVECGGEEIKVEG